MNTIVNFNFLPHNLNCSRQFSPSAFLIAFTKLPNQYHQCKDLVCSNTPNQLPQCFEYKRKAKRPPHARYYVLTAEVCVVLRA